ncbi:hypothetical protein EAH_00010840 [Eimeria acervulina]|uniref:Uncharacterized protein n=1 Tax=Eimeria acervulina TaxID=5801 RepID=U6GJB9_EIMAC|nr:hypothetical protein EAH_00010840 [Eimeria acervulina]CDI79393.1 hypothetical protein EAH_00010840 [Eimeria acervulina]
MTFLIITCFRLTSTQQAVQTRSWVRLASSKEGGDDDAMCPGWQPTEETDQRLPQADAQEDLMATGEGAQEGQGEPTDEVAGEEGQRQPEDSVGREEERGEKQFQADSEGGAAEPYQQGTLVGGATRMGEQLEEHSLGGAAGGEAPQQQEELMGGSARGELQQQPVNSLGGAAGGKEPHQHEKPMGVGPRPGDIPEEKRKTEISTPAPGEHSGGATAPEVLEESTCGGSGARSPHHPRKRKRKTKHTETVTPPPLPTYRGPYSDVNAPRDSDEEDDDTPTYRWPTGSFYDIKGPRLEVPPPPAKHGRILGPKKPAKGDSQGGAKDKALDKAKGGTQPESQSEDKRAKDQRSKVGALTQIVGECVSYAEELSSTKGANLGSAAWLLNVVSNSLTVQICVARQTSQSVETEEACRVAEAAVDAAHDWIVRHGGTPETAHLSGEGPVTEESRDSLSVRLLVLHLASNRLTEQLRHWRPGPSVDYLKECEKLLKMAETLLAGTEQMLGGLINEGQHAAAEILTQALEVVEDLTEEMRLVTRSGASNPFAAEVPNAPALSALTSLDAATTAAEALLDSMAGGVDLSIRAIAGEQLASWTHLLSSVELLLGGDGIDGSLLQRCIDAACHLRERVEIIQAVLSSTSTR